MVGVVCVDNTEAIEIRRERMQTDLPTPHALVPEQIPLKSSVLQATVSAAQVF